MFTDIVASWVYERLKEFDDVPMVTDYVVGLRYSYVVVEGSRGRELGVSITPTEDLWGTKYGIPCSPSTYKLFDLISSLNPLEKSLGIALLNALSQYLLWDIVYKDGMDIHVEKIFDAVKELVEEPIHVVGNMGPLIKHLRENGFREITVTERNPYLRCGVAISDSANARLASRSKTLIITGATLVNDTIDQILASSSTDAKILLIGPTTAIHPLPAFKQGVAAIMSFRAIDIDAVGETIRHGGGRWDFTKYCMEYVAQPASINGL